MPSFRRSSNSPKPPGSTSSVFNFSANSSNMADFGSSDLPFRNSLAASDRGSVTNEASSPNGSSHPRGVDRVVRELTRYLDVLRPKKKQAQQQADDDTSVCGLHIEELLTAPLFSWSVKLALADERKRGRTPASAHFDQFALLGQERTTATTRASAHNPDGVEPIFLNTNAPWSAFLCGSQGSGKSHTLAVMLEGCLLPNKALGRLPEPLQGIVFHADALAAGGVCEAAHLCSAGVEVNVLVSPSNYWRLRQAYANIPDPQKCLNVRQLRLKPKHLNVERMLSLMAFNESNGRVPLYMEVINKILREMATSAQQSFQFDYKRFIRLLEQERLTGDQKGPMTLRLQLLESFLDVDGTDDNNNTADMFSPPPGSLTIVDLTDPFIDASSACTLFDICLALFLEDAPPSPSPQSPPSPSLGRVIALDEAHKYLSATSTASDRFTDSLLTAIRVQRHAGTRIIVATQEPTVSPKLLDLCSLTLVHRFASPAWLAVLRQHLAGLSAVAGRSEEEVRALFEEIVTLGVGEGLVFAPSAMVRVFLVEGGGGRGAGAPKRIAKLGTECLRFRTRPRLTSDGGRSVLAIR
ncbi:p-loop containing nucleoside triphosphate hydrolase [Diplodia corticola]|uniref:p-loop containing nucleoside triphosphate hydrolase n=1 Tax=Diplodia corticola TaxID=236234 RepID=A0A1J9S9T4_9PEZI|nr:p-loop containing nucleoside triphosphate hydrolase [Diplodia corticola]OJD36652.1 p-loop containing nucleoside triphosphate hydrolase [Diplodia corticola]